MPNNEWVSLFGPVLRKDNPLLGGKPYPLKYPYPIPAEPLEDESPEEDAGDEHEEAEEHEEEAQESMLIQIIHMLVQLLGGRRIPNANKQ